MIPQNARVVSHQVKRSFNAARYEVIGIRVLNVGSPDCTTKHYPALHTTIQKQKGEKRLIRQKKCGQGNGAYPIRRPKPSKHDYKGPRPKPGQTVMLCPVEARMRVFQFTPRETLRCEDCSFEIAREETQ